MGYEEDTVQGTEEVVEETTTHETTEGVDGEDEEE